MSNIRVYINYHNNASSLLLIPILKYYKYFKQKGIKFSFGFSTKPLRDNSDQVWISSRWLGHKASQKPDWDYIEWLNDLKAQNKIIKFFDLSDSAGNLIRDILPIVDIYYKTYIYTDLSIYEKNLIGGRYFTDLIFESANNDYRPSTEHIGYNSINPQYISKLKIFWNHSYLYCDDFFSRLFSYGSITKNILKVRKRFKKDILFTGRFNTSYRNKIIHEYRKKFTLILNSKGIPTDKISVSDFIEELVRSKVCFSPYGWGEFAYRDYEAWLAECALVKPDMSKIETFPVLYHANKNYIPINIDLSNLEDVIDQIQKSQINYQEIASFGHQNFLEIISPSLTGDKLRERMEQIILSKNN